MRISHSHIRMDRHHYPLRTTFPTKLKSFPVSNRHGGQLIFRCPLCVLESNDLHFGQ
eukprot:TRINITY_DN11986_c0_g1_i1.p1 TRINITY_DN11986_c0_g1~~TRINITY_DN11986_c0_g1_i1.p1  ORF type:complete len:57 (-),score=2.61 TRINITY_DN11986_c0_g1_i1:12-182(-)